MTPDRVSTYERLLQVIGHTGMPGVPRLIGKLAPPYDGSRHFMSDFFGLIYAGDLSELIDWHVFYFGAYAKGELAFLGHCAEILGARCDDLNFFDVGANAGQHSLFMSRKVREVHAFEPSSKTAKRFQKNIEINCLRNVFLHRVALADADAEAMLGSGFKGNSGSRSLSWSLPGGLTEKVQVRDGDMFFRAHGLPRMHLLKIDVEGHEKKVLHGLKHRLSADRPLIVMELIGAPECKGGFKNECELRDHLYPEHELRSLVERRGRYRLTEFDWDCESAVVLPSELCGSLLN